MPFALFQTSGKVSEVFIWLFKLHIQMSWFPAWFNVWVKNQNQDVLIEDDSSQDYTDYAGGNLTMGLIYDRRLTHAGKKP